VAVAIAAGGHHACVVRDSGEVFCWGIGAAGELGDGTMTDSPAPRAVLGLDGPAVAVVAGRAHTCVLLTGGRVRCWGEGSSGQLGNGAMTRSLSPVAVVGSP